MLLKEDRYETDQETARAERVVDASQAMLLTEYGILLRTAEPLRTAVRVVAISLAVLQCLQGPFPWAKQIVFLVVTALTCGFWALQELVNGKRLQRLGELLAATNSELTATGSKQAQRPVVLPPKKESQAATLAPSNSFSNVEQPQRSFSQLWTNSYISWQLERWKERRLRVLQRSEPILWFLLILIAGIYRIH